MKLQKHTIIVAFLFFVSITAGNIFAQDSNKKIHLKVIKNGETTVDTSFTTESLESDDLHKKISELAGVEIDLHKGHGDHMHMAHADKHGNHTWTSHEKKGHKVIIMKSDSVEDGESKKVAYFYSTGDDDNFTMKTDSAIFIDADTIILKKKGNVIIVDGDEKMSWVEKESGEDDKDLKVIIEKVDGEVEDHSVIIIKDGKVIKKGHSTMILEEIDEDGSGQVKVTKVVKSNGDEEKTINVYISDKEGGIHTHESGDVEIIVTDGKSGTEFVNKTVKVVKSESEEGDEIEITVEIEEGEDVKSEKATKEISKETKQKKEKKRTSK